jgi:hypothetical protein
MIVRRAEALHLACRDLLDVGICAGFLLDAVDTAPQLDPRVRHVLETGMLVSYARPFTGSGGRPIRPAHDLSQELRNFHNDIMTRRNKVYAHTDHTEMRQIRDLRLSDAAARLTASNDQTIVHEQWDSLSDAGLECVGVLARIHYTESHAELDRLRIRLASLDRSDH